MGVKGYCLQGSTMGSWEIEKFFENNDFVLWNVKMQAISIQEKLIDALKGEECLSKAENTKLMDEFKSITILFLGDKVQREVAKEQTTTATWEKLESLYMTKSLPHMLYLKQQLYSFWMVENKFIVEQLIEFYEILRILKWRLKMRTRLYSYWTYYLDPLNTLRMPFFMVRKVILLWMKSRRRRNLKNFQRRKNWRLMIMMKVWVS